MKRLWILFLIMTWTVTTGAQNVRFFISSDQITTAEALVLSVEVQGIRQLASPQFPRIAGFRQVGTSTNQSYINGAAKITFSASYYPNQAGTYEIAPFKYNAGGKDYTSERFKVKVVRTDKQQAQTQQKRQDDLFQRLFGSPFDDFFKDPFSNNPATQPKKEDFKETNADYFLSINLDRDTAYVGEQVFGEVALYINVFDRNKIQIEGEAVRDFNNRMKIPEFWQEVFDLSQIPAETVNINGKMYIKYTFYRSILFPLNVGEIKFKDIYIDGRKLYVATTGSPFDAFFPSNQKFEPLKIKAKDRSLFVKPLPPSELPNASMVGKFKMEAQLSDTVINTGEILELKVRVKGNGNMAMMQEPSAKIPTEFETDPPSSEFNTYKTDNSQYGEKDFTWSMVPTKHGNYDLGPVKMYFFNPTKKSYDSLVVDGIRVRVEGDDLDNIVLKSSGIDMFYSNGIDNSSDQMASNKFSGKWGVVLLLLTVVGSAVYGGMKFARSRVKSDAEKDQDDAQFWG